MLRRALSIAAFAPQVKPNPHRSPLTTHLSPFTLTLGAPAVPPRFAMGFMATYWGYSSMAQVEG